MKRIFTFTVICLFITLASHVLAKDDEATAKRLVQDLPTAQQRPDYYTTKHGFMNDADLPASPGGPLEKGMYIMSWLVLSPPIKLKASGGNASMSKDLYKDHFGVPELDVSKDPANYPRAGLESINKNELDEDMYWIPINFQDLVDAEQGSLFASGNEFDWVEWGGQGLNQFHVYMFCLVKWNNGGNIAFAAGSDDPEVTWVNGQKVCEGLADRDWTADQDKGEYTVSAGEWVAIFVEVGENGGECGYTLEVNPPPDDHTLDVEGSALAVSPRSKLTTVWGYVKTR